MTRQVVVFGQQRGRGKTSGMGIGESQAHVYMFPDGKIVRWQMFHDRREAKPSVYWSKALTPTPPEPAGYCAGDVAGERGTG
jgi:hypothetical protein